jgi:hypothetical protein
MIRKAIIVVLTLATVLLWVDSYRARVVPVTSEFASFANWLGRMHVPEQVTTWGREVHHTWDDETICTLATIRGTLWSAYYSKIEPGQEQRVRATALAGFGYRSSAQKVFRPGPDGPLADYRETVVTAPLWFPLAVFAAYPVMAFIHGPVRRYRRRRKGLCIKCGYDLTGNVSGACPECGESV